METEKQNESVCVDVDCRERVGGGRDERAESKQRSEK